MSWIKGVENYLGYDWRYAANTNIHENWSYIPVMFVNKSGGELTDKLQVEVVWVVVGYKRFGSQRRLHLQG
jgi:hypothetical protein